MLVRIVKMHFCESEIPSFLKSFNTVKEKIRDFPGCKFLELYRGEDDPNIFFTYSYWNTAQDLENYRHSELFKSVWAETKVKFSAKPEAWSVNKIVSLK
ncbi:antibiotic biosynthesis monooxygenase [Dokdonia sinensis]|uniref:Antibiotic biosynthesis monooxygenase n=1 Tax=Dokdonia sinensis TaxID=2479847 RepID=A0A3M0G5X6_9FLAO|nr:antibiotic biosynthesis monooxygenase family protein [Dokdonia sinensis]RMB57672.1 antibiotic biosynthesis monooxygenase [Dokdonia sinensis]